MGGAQIVLGEGGGVSRVVVVVMGVGGGRENEEEGVNIEK